MKPYRIAAVLLRKGDEIVLIRQRIASIDADLWLVPAGGVEDHEDHLQAARREAQEETGLTPQGESHLAYICEYESHTDGFFCSVHMYVFEDFTGAPLPQDPDGEVLEARLFSKTEALNFLAQVPWPMVREPMLAFLSGVDDEPQYWKFGTGPDGEYACIEKRPL
jgi:8-oxo-dGTP diphosphatase